MTRPVPVRSFSALVAIIALLAVAGPLPAAAQEPPPNPQVVVETTLGDFTIELLRADAPVSVSNFLTYVLAGYYDNTIFHRVIRGVIIQGGGLTADLMPKVEGLRGGILNEATNRVSNRRGTVAVARLAEPNSGRAQFFVNVGHNDSFNHRNVTSQGYGYAVFGRIVDGMDVVDDISRVRTTRVDRLDDVPRDPVVINTIRRVEP